MQISESVAFVTGANRGLGKAFTDALVARGATTVYAAARNPDTITDPRLTPVRLDVTDPASVAAAASLAGDADLVINNAGISRGGSVLGADVADVRAQLETNLLGPLEVTRAFAPVLARNGGGALVNVLSALSWMSFSSLAGYSASKAAAWSLTNATRAELRGQGTLVVGVHMGYVDTDMAASVEGPKADPVDVVTQVLDAVEAGQDEVLGDDVARQVRAALSGPVADLAV
ncbi:SDR family oxidoreductase [Nocardioides sp. LHG3406-4]|uniref:SDR family oxidoreductase n=1 Tax=Nocardioides sp. LHG3406-4 TaxID=2804575 RepID=UPI003CFB8E87